jgi:hypothetical protein
MFAPRHLFPTLCAAASLAVATPVHPEVAGACRDQEFFAQLQALAAREPAFRAFVLRHIDATADPDELNQALHNATTQCPAGAASLCEDIVARAQSVIEDL